MGRVREIHRRRGGRREIELDGGERLCWPAPVVSEVDVESGEEVSISKLKQRLQQAAANIFPAKAREYLAQYEQTSHRFREHFERKGYPTQLINSLIPTLREEGYLDDERCARAHVERRLRNKPRGRRKIIAELCEKGVDRELARSVVEAQVDAETERRLARRYCEDNKGLSKRKLAGRLQTRGFPPHLIRELLNEYSGDDGNKI